MSTDTTTLSIKVAGMPDCDEEELSDVTIALRRQLLELDVESVEQIRNSDAPPSGAKSAYAATIGSLVVALVPAALASVMSLLRTWMKNRPIREITATIGGDTIKITNPTRGDEHLITDAFVLRHSTPPRR